uniref:Uncharacterized protein n=1 Tax=Rhizophora mucronata TaxID=61149 RepID=A0A2P2QXG4_RHIMU
MGTELLKYKSDSKNYRKLLK